ncbi:unnamed protein product [Symbiodinium natans]|uniref:Uncharacterized protein n=1 Tax=Symbiodinium natans TaxID=878477 RepID=A0A812LIQ9_9DINO|nr:unnamed protein product [Symbiodinium natans]
MTMLLVPIIFPEVPEARRWALAICCRPAPEPAAHKPCLAQGSALGCWTSHGEAAGKITLLAHLGVCAALSLSESLYGGRSEILGAYGGGRTLAEVPRRESGGEAHAAHASCQEAGAVHLRGPASLAACLPDLLMVHARFRLTCLHRLRCCVTGRCLHDRALLAFGLIPNRCGERKHQDLQGTFERYSSRQIEALSHLDTIAEATKWRSVGKSRLPEPECYFSEGCMQVIFRSSQNVHATARSSPLAWPGTVDTQSDSRLFAA